MLELIVAALAWLATHLGLGSAPLRGAIASRIGEGPFRGLFSLLALGMLWWLISAWSHAPRDLWLWAPAPWQRLVPIVAMPFALILLVCGLAGPNPTAAGQEARVGDPASVRGILRITRHPVQWAILIWALSHAVANGDAATLVLVSAIAATSALGMHLMDRKLAARLGDAWSGFARATSVLPFAAIAAGRNRLRLAEIGIVRPLVGLLAYGALMHFHAWFAGVPVLMS